MRVVGEASQGDVHNDVGKEWQHHAGKRIHSSLCMHAGYVFQVGRMGVEAYHKFSIAYLHAVTIGGRVFPYERKR